MVISILVLAGTVSLELLWILSPGGRTFPSHCSSPHFWSLLGSSHLLLDPVSGPQQLLVSLGNVSSSPGGADGTEGPRGQPWQYSVQEFRNSPGFGNPLCRNSGIHLDLGILCAGTGIHLDLGTLCAETGILLDLGILGAGTGIQEFRNSPGFSNPLFRSRNSGIPLDLGIYPWPSGAPLCSSHCLVIYLCGGTVGMAQGPQPAPGRIFRQNSRGWGFVGSSSVPAICSRRRSSNGNTQIKFALTRVHFCTRV